MENPLLATSILLGLGSAIIGLLAILKLDEVTDSFVKSQLLLQPDAPVVKTWEKPPVTPQMKVYLFNLTNEQEFLNGSKPILQEIGPFVYDEKWEKKNVTWTENGTKVTFYQEKAFYFNEMESIYDDSVELILPNIPVLTSFAYVKLDLDLENDKDHSIAENLINFIEDNDNSGPFLRKTVKEYLWGYKDKLSTLSTEHGKWPFDEFGVFVGKNNSSPGNMTILTGKEDTANLGQVVAFEGQSSLKFSKKCKMVDVKGYDGATFHPGIEANESSLRVFNRDLCQSLPLVYQKAVDNQGLPCLRFVPTEDAFSENCFCDKECNVPRGLFSLSSCQPGRPPLLLSWPHFYQANTSLVESLEGLQPDASKHQFFIDLQPKLGTALKAQVRVQINIQMFKDEDFEPAKNMRDLVYPVLWFAEGIEAIDDEDALNLMNMAVHFVDLVNKFTGPISLSFGLVLILISITCYVCQNCRGKKKPETNSGLEMSPK